MKKQSELKHSFSDTLLFYGVADFKALQKRICEVCELALWGMRCPQCRSGTIFRRELLLVISASVGAPWAFVQRCRQTRS